MRVAIVTEKATGEFVAVYANKKLAMQCIKAYFADIETIKQYIDENYDIQTVSVIE